MLKIALAVTMFALPALANDDTTLRGVSPSTASPGIAFHCYDQGVEKPCAAGAQTSSIVRYCEQGWIMISLSDHSQKCVREIKDPK